MKLEKNHWLSNAYLVFVFAVLYAPIFYLIYYSFNSGGGMNDFQSFTLEHYRAVLGDTRLIGIVIDTLSLNKNCLEGDIFHFNFENIARSIYWPTLYRKCSYW